LECPSWRQNETEKYETNVSHFSACCDAFPKHIYLSSAILILSFLINLGADVNQIQQTFNVIAEAFPSIARKIKLFWGHQEFTDLLHDLIHSTRDHSRTGFSLQVTSALLDMQEWHDRRFPQFSIRSANARTVNHRTVELSLS
jgi:hypothetical protein